MTPPGGMRGLIGRWLGDPASPAAPLPEFALPTGEGPLVWMRIGAGHGQSAADDTALPPRGKIVGSYVNSALIKSEAVLNGFDEALVLNHDGHVAEGSAENFFIVRGDSLIRPPKGYEADHPHIEDLKRKDFIAVATYSEVDAVRPEFIDEFAGCCRNASPFMAFLTTSIGLPW